MKLLAEVLATLEAANISHALIGAGAMAIHGVSRATLDLDLLTTDRLVLGAGLWERLRGEGIEVEARRGDSEDPLAGVVRFRKKGERSVDLVVGRHSWQERIVRRSDRRTVEGVVIPVVRAADLILSKLFAGGSQDAWDIDQLLTAGDRDYLAGEVESSLGELPSDCADLWRKIRGG